MSNNRGTEERIRMIAQGLKPLLVEDSGCEFNYWQGTEAASLKRIYDEEELPAMLRSWDLYDHYAHSEIDWPKDWTDKTPIYIDRVDIYNDKTQVFLLWEFSFNFLVHKYYCIDMVLPGIMFSSRKNRMKASSIIPAAVKDLEVFFRTLNDSLRKYGIDSSELVWRDLEHPSVVHFGLHLNLKTDGMTEDEVVEATMRRAKALAEYRRNFRAWLPSDERRQCYESTRRPKKRGWQYLCAWPLGIPNFEEKYNAELVRVMKESIGRYYKYLREYERGWLRRKPTLSEYYRFYNLDGYAVRFRGKAYYDDGAEAKLLADMIKVDDGEIVVDKRVRLRPFPPERISFLRDEYPELFE